MGVFGRDACASTPLYVVPTRPPTATRETRREASFAPTSRVLPSGRKKDRTPMRSRLLVAPALAIALLAVPVAASARTTEVAEPFPVCFALFDPVQFPEAASDVTGFRLSLFYGRNAGMMGLDLGCLVSVVDDDLFGLELSGLVNSVGSSSGSVQLAGIANNCYEDFYGLQLSGIANRTGGNIAGGQISCFNMAEDMDGFQIGLYNKAAKATGLQIGVINEAASMQGVQIGLLNIIHDSQLPYMILLNANF